MASWSSITERPHEFFDPTGVLLNLPPILKHLIFAIFAVTLMRHLNHNTGGTSEFQDVNPTGRETTDKNETLSFDTAGSDTLRPARLIRSQRPTSPCGISLNGKKSSYCWAQFSVRSGGFNLSVFAFPSSPAAAATERRGDSLNWALKYDFCFRLMDAAYWQPEIAP